MLARSINVMKLNFDRVEKTSIAEFFREVAIFFAVMTPFISAVLYFAAPDVRRPITGGILVAAFLSLNACLIGGIRLVFMIRRHRRFMRSQGRRDYVAEFRKREKDQSTLSVLLDDWQDSWPNGA